jgi:hypothetical protein
MGQVSNLPSLRLAPNAPNLGATAQNVVQLPNGAAGTVNPAAGGYFYVLNGALHWVSQNGTDTQVAPA